MDVEEVTVKRYKACVDAGKCTPPSVKYSTCTWNKAGQDNHPVNCVDWNQARTYCWWLGKGYDLPTEAQWEKAARGGCEHNGGQAGCKAGMRIYPWGDQTAWCGYAVKGDGCANKGPAPVSSKPLGIGPYGTTDMSGNVREWVLDWYSKDFYKSSPKNQPYNVKTSQTRVNRGGGFGQKAVELRGSARHQNWAQAFYDVIGFRCVLN